MSTIIITQILKLCADALLERLAYFAGAIPGIPFHHQLPRSFPIAGRLNETHRLHYCKATGIQHNFAAAEDDEAEVGPWQRQVAWQ